MTGIKSHTIKLLLRKKIKEWLASIEHEELRKELAENVIVTGGCITSFLLGEKPNDYDFYLRDFNTTVRAAVYYATQFNNTIKLKVNSAKPYKVRVKVSYIKNIQDIEEKRIIFYMQSAGIAAEDQESYEYFESLPEASTIDFADSISTHAEHLLEEEPVETIEELNASLKVTGKDEHERKPYRPVFLTDNAATLANRVQLITRFYGEPNEIHNNFDFVHAMCYYDYKHDLLVLQPEALEAILTKTLIYKGSLYPIASIFRIRKFLNRGWRISAGQMLKIIFQINELDLNDKTILREQLIGVDVAYMGQLIAALQNLKTYEKIDGTYVATLIDKIFDE